MLATDTFWALVALIIFLALLAWLKVPAMMGRWLDERSKRISDELDEARRLREEAQQLLAEYQRKRAEAEKEAEEIIAIAKREADALAEDARTKMEDYVARRNRLAEQKIAQAESEAINAVRSTAVDMAVAAAGEIISNQLDSKKNNDLFKNSVSEIKSKLN